MCVFNGIKVRYMEWKKWRSRRRYARFLEKNKNKEFLKQEKNRKKVEENVIKTLNEMTEEEKEKHKMTMEELKNLN